MAVGATCCDISYVLRILNEVSEDSVHNLRILHTKGVDFSYSTRSSCTDWCTKCGRSALAGEISPAMLAHLRHRIKRLGTVVNSLPDAVHVEHVEHEPFIAPPLGSTIASYALIIEYLD